MIKTYFYSHSEQNMRHDVDLDQKHRFLKDEEDLLWVDLYKFSEEEIKYVAKIFNFHPLAVEDCLSYSPRPKLDNYEDYYFFVMHALRYDEESEEEISWSSWTCFWDRISWSPSTSNPFRSWDGLPG